jgi:hypothetical protein
MPFLVLAVLGAVARTRRAAFAIGFVLLSALTIYEFAWMMVSSGPGADNSLLSLALLGSWVVGIPLVIGVVAIDHALQGPRAPRRA